ncbi:hypothetical protein U1Q18_011703 [Sarracenia purpurea var. burkii]
MGRRSIFSPSILSVHCSRLPYKVTFLRLVDIISPPLSGSFGNFLLLRCNIVFCNRLEEDLHPGVSLDGSKRIWQFPRYRRQGIPLQNLQYMDRRSLLAPSIPSVNHSCLLCNDRKKIYVREVVFMVRSGTYRNQISCLKIFHGFPISAVLCWINIEDIEV